MAPPQTCAERARAVAVAAFASSALFAPCCYFIHGMAGRCLRAAAACAHAAATASLFALVLAPPLIPFLALPPLAALVVLALAPSPLLAALVVLALALPTTMAAYVVVTLPLVAYLTATAVAIRNLLVLCVPLC